MKDKITLPKLEKRFLPPKNWKSDVFLNPETNHKIHYNFLELPKNKKPKGIIVIPPGLSEFGEKYIETARDCVKKGYKVYVIDWAYQGRSTRLEDDPHKRTSDGYDADVSDLHFLISNIIKPEIPLFMMSHSMGGNIGLRYLVKYKDIFQAASFSAPMLGILRLKNVEFLAKSLVQLISLFENLYVRGSQDWHEGARKSDGQDIFSSDPKRDLVHNAWCLANPQLQVGSPNIKWIHESMNSIDMLRPDNVLTSLETPCLFAYAGLDALVDNEAIMNAAQKIPNASLLEFTDAKHEILMETDEIRDKFLKKTFELFDKALASGPN
ncbi:MAG: alpha/beta hydrolase [Alphaproteobacteria bacterium]|nr:alpha/beta hydrolase [Alphaproteobacteria bacterium]